jgi:hypothetical protein
MPAEVVDWLYADPAFLPKLLMPCEPPLHLRPRHPASSCLMLVLFAAAAATCSLRSVGMLAFTCCLPSPFLVSLLPAATLSCPVVFRLLAFLQYENHKHAALWYQALLGAWLRRQHPPVSLCRNSAGRGQAVCRL